MKEMFRQCHELKIIKGINKFNTIKVTNMKAMFSECYCLKHLDLKNFNTSEVRNMRTMFGKCSELQFLDVSNFDISNVRYFEFMFYKFYKLKDFKGIDIFISKNISNVKGYS